jgi:hypothetical protein
MEFSGVTSHPSGEMPWSERGAHTSTTTTRRRRNQSEQKVSKKTSITTKNTEQLKFIEKTATHKFLSPLVGEHREQRVGGHE